MPVPPPKVKPKVIQSSSKDLVPTGPRHVTSANHPSNRDEVKPTTARALVLRNGKHGARGTGEIVHVSKLSGREKLDLLAEDLVEKSTKAVMAPFRLEKCMKIAESQCTAYLDDIASLQDPSLFSSLIEAELKARAPVNTDSKAPDPSRNPSYVASAISTRVHNSYMLASGWKLVADTLHELGQAGVVDYKIKTQLKTDPDIRSHYLILYDMVKVLVELSQTKVSVLATTTPHYHKYFRQAETDDPDQAGIIFDWGALRDAGRSFLDSIVIELCFPRAPYPKAVLYQILHDAVEESPKEASRFPQALWDAVGDLSISVELQELLEASLAGPDGAAWKDLPRTMPEEYQEWVDAQYYSEAAAEKYANFKDFIFPLAKTKSVYVLQNMWKNINLNYKAQCNKDIDTLWNLHEVMHRTPQWHSVYLESSKGPFDSSGTPLGPKKFGKRKPLTITNGEQSDDSMPELQSVSNSSEDESDEEDSDADSNVDSSSDDAESGYDTEGEDEMREMLREAMDAALEGEYFQSGNVPPEMDPFLSEDRKGNPFLKLLGSLRGRMFNSSPKLRTGPRGPKTSFFASNNPTPSPFTSAGRGTASKPAAAPATSGPQSFKPTVEEVEDEDDASVTGKKKKKKNKKRKKPTTADSGQSPSIVAQPPPAVPASPSAPPRAAANAPVSPAKKATAPKSPVSPPKPGLNPAQMSTASLLPVEQTTAQSARSYLQTEHLTESKTKVKSRPDHASLFSAPEKEKKKGFLDRLGVGKTKEETEKKGGKRSWFNKLTKKANGYMHQLLKTSQDDYRGLKPMKWEQFLKIMREMGFEYDPSTAGSSVRFDPPDSRDPPITFHKPHPDPTIQPIMLRNFAKRLKTTYGWSEADLHQ